MTNSSQILFDRAVLEGFATLNRGDAALPTLRKIIKLINAESIKVARIRTTLSAAARPNTLSSRYGVSRFPPHTDFAHANLPPHYLLLFCPVPRNVRTFIYHPKDISPTLAADLKHGLFRVKGPNNAFTSRISSCSPTRSLLRFNVDVMQPLDYISANIANFIVNKWKPSATIDWNTTSILLIDNWSVLHGRSEQINDASGWAWRFAIWSK